ncbi:MAG: Heimdall-CTERM domain-containing surface protein [Candidatus Hodarchaeota archaeon]
MMKKRTLLLLILSLLYFMNVGGVNPYPEGFKTINQPNIGFISDSFNTTKQGAYEFGTSIKNTGDPATEGEVPISWEKYQYEMQLSDGMGTLSESVSDYDLNGDGDKEDTFDVVWNDTIRPWDAIINGAYVYAIADHPENRRFNRTYYINGEPKLFQLGNKRHTLYFANNNGAFFGFDAVIVKHPSPNFELVIYSNVSISDYKIDGTSVNADYTYKGVEEATDGSKRSYIAVVVETSEIDTDETQEFSCKITAHQTITCQLAIIMNWSPDGSTRYSWITLDKQVSVEKFITTPDENGIPGFSFLTSLLILLPLSAIIYRRKRL